MNKQNTILIPADVVEQSRFQPGENIAIHIGENTLVVLPEKLTALQAVNAIALLADVGSDLVSIVKEACGTCEERLEAGLCPSGHQEDPDRCPVKSMDGPGVTLSASLREEAGIPLDARLEVFPNGAPTRAQRSGSRGERRSDGAGELFADRRKRASAVRDDAGEVMIAAADYEHDLSDVPPAAREVLALAGVCPGHLDQLIMSGEIIHEA